MKENKRVIYFDILNIIAIIAVIAMHCNGIVHGNPNTRAWNLSLIVECLCYFAVPLFCMLSGATLMNYRKKYDTKTFFKKRMLKVLIPFLLWAIFMFVWKIYKGQLNIKSINGPATWINAFFANREESTYYFMFEILGIYLTMPLLSLLTKEEYRKTLWFTVLLFFIFNAFLPNILSLAGITFNSSFSVRIGGYIIFVILGYLLSTQEVNKKYRILIYAGALVGLIYRYSTTFILSKEAGKVIKTTWGYTSWHSILLTCAVFLLVKNINVEKMLEGKEQITNTIKKISSCSFGVYLIHTIVKYYYISALDINTSSWTFRTFGIIAVYGISLIVILILKKIPILRKIVP